MKLLVNRSMEENKDSGFLGWGQEKILRTFRIRLKLEDVSEEEMELLELYTYITKGGDRKRYTELPINLFEKDRYRWLQDNNLIKGGRSVRVKKLMDGKSWESSALFDEFVRIPEIVTDKLVDILNDIEVGKLWTEESEREEIEIVHEEDELNTAN